VAAAPNPAAGQVVVGCPAGLISVPAGWACLADASRYAGPCIHPWNPA